jgi:hypothetical protein
MADPPPVTDDEVVLRHVPGVLVADDVASSNFELRHDKGETYVSVSRERITDSVALLKLVKSTPASRVIAARVGDIRALGLRVEPRPSRRNPGHAGVEPGSASLDDEAVRILLSELFYYLDPD